MAVSLPPARAGTRARPAASATAALHRIAARKKPRLPARCTQAPLSHAADTAHSLVRVPGHTMASLARVGNTRCSKALERGIRRGSTVFPGERRPRPARHDSKMQPVPPESQAPFDEPDFEQLVQEAVDALPPALRRQIANVEIAVEDEPPPGTSYLGLYQGIPLTRR